MALLAICLVLFIYFISGLVSALPNGNLEDFKNFEVPQNGYILHNGTTKGDQRKIKYRYHSAQSKLKNEALIVWLNGESDCLPLLEFSDELGPPIGMTSKENLFPWNKLGNFLIIESSQKNVFTDLMDFFDVHPEAQSNEIFLLGQGRNGISALDLASKILKQQELNLKGVLLMNSALSAKEQFNSLVNFGYIRGITGKSEFDQLKRNCDTCFNKTSIDCEYFSHERNSTCKREAVKMNWKSLKQGLESSIQYENLKDIQARAKKFYEQDQDIEEHLLGLIDHDLWKSKKLKLLFIYGDLDTLYNHIGAAWFLEKFVDKYLGQEEVTIKIDDFVVFDFVDSKPWHFSYDEKRFCPTIGGFVKSFPSGIDFATIKGAGHCPYFDQPAQTFQILRNFILGFDYSADLSEVDIRFQLEIKKKKQGTEIFKRSSNISVKVANVTFDFENSKHKDQIVFLPGLRFTSNFRQFSGFLKGFGAHRMHYWLVESQNNPSKDPLILWLNGGPGASSLSGFFKENGPFRVGIKGDSLNENPYSWNKFANVLYLESPVGVGYSFSENSSEKFEWNDENTADENYAVLLDFFNLFPQYQNRDFYITGESYAGVYLPMLALRLINGSKSGDFKGNFKGMAIGNGVFDYDLIRADSLFHLLYYSGFTTYKAYRRLIHHCCQRVDEIGCKFSDSIKWSNLGFPKPRGKVNACFQMIAKIFYEDFMNSEINKCSPYDDCLLKTQRDDLNTDDLKQLKISYSCYSKNAVKSYLRRKDVRKALNVGKSVPAWQSYEKDSPNCKKTDSNFLFRPWELKIFPKNKILAKYKRQYLNMEELIAQVFDSGVKTLIYSGDTDLQANHLAAEWFFARLVENHGLKILQPRTEWFLESDFTRVAGYQIQYEKNLELRTIKGAGHMAPSDRPEPSYQMIYNWINGNYHKNPVE